MIYEQPLNEHYRLALRLEYLFGQIEYYLKKLSSSWDNHQIIKAILEVLQAIDRPDLKNKFLQILMQYQQTLSQLGGHTGVDRQKLSEMLSRIQNLMENLHANQKKIGQTLRSNEFLNAIQQRLYTPAGTCGFSLPVYQLWLAQDIKVRERQILAWLETLEPLKEIVAITLTLIREGNSLFQPVEAVNGFYQCSLDPNVVYHMVRIKVARSYNVFPEISVGRYHMAIHFLQLQLEHGSKQSPELIKFELACCKF